MLGNQTLNLNQAEALDFAQRNTESYEYAPTMAAISNPHTPKIQEVDFWIYYCRFRWNLNNIYTDKRNDQPLES